MPQKVTVPRGRKIDIPLRIYGRQREQLRYLIKRRPCSKPRAIEWEISIIAYEPPDLAVISERFTFSVQNSAGVSVPVEVTIAITDEAPRLIIPDTLEVGELLAGGAATKEIEIASRGAVTFVHRFGSALNANLHFHCAIIDGVWGCQGRVRFHEATALSQ